MSAYDLDVVRKVVSIIFLPVVKGGRVSIAVLVKYEDVMVVIAVLVKVVVEFVVEFAVVVVVVVVVVIVIVLVAEVDIVDVLVELSVGCPADRVGMVRVG